MALLFADGFEDGAAAWTLLTMTNGTGRFGNGLVMSGGNGSAELGFAATAGPIIVGHAVKPAAAQAAQFSLYNTASTTAQVGFLKTAAGEIMVYRGAVANVLATSAVGVVAAGAWSYVEAKVVIHDTTGSVVVRVNGVEVINVSNVDTKQGADATVNLVRLGATLVTSGVIGNAYDDVYICDTTGSYNNDFLGDVTVEHLRPAADDTVTWLGSDGDSVNNYALVDESGAYDGADYVQSGTVGQRDLYTTTPSAKAPGVPVAGVVAVAVAMRDDSGSLTMKLNIKEGATVRESSTLGLPTTFGELSAVFDRKADGSAWTVADVNALRMGYEVTA